MKNEMIVDQQSLKQLIYITSVDRTMGPVEKDRIITVKAYIIHDVLETIDVLNRLLTGDLQKFIFTDQPDRYWEGKVKSGIKPSNSEQWSKIEIEIEVPDGVAYAIEPKTISVSNQESVTLTNNGTEAFYPTFDFHTTAETYMVSAVTNDAVFQYGESLDAAPTKKVNVSRVETTDGHETTKTQLFYNGRWDGAETHPYEVEKLVDSWVTSGNWHKRGGSISDPKIGDKAKIATWANHWQTGEKMDSWVKGKSFPVVQIKNVNQGKSKKAYLLKNGNYYLGWVLEQDIDTGGGGSTGKNPNDLIPAYGANVGEKWRGPAMRYYIDGHCTNWDCHVWLNYFKERPNERGAFYFAIMRGDTVIASIQLSSHQNNMHTWINFNARQQGMDMGSYDKQFASHMWGRLHINKNGNKFTFDVMKDNGKKLQRSYTVPGDDLEPSHVLVWAGVYGAFPHAQEISAVKLNFQGNNTKVWVSPKDETVTEIMNLPDPSTIIPAGETVRLEMSTGLAYRNGGESLTPIQYGSKPVKILPGEQEIILACDGDQQPDVDIYYREVFR